MRDGGKVDPKVQFAAGPDTDEAGLQDRLRFREECRQLGLDPETATPLEYALAFISRGKRVH